MPPNIMARSVLVATILLLLLGVPVEAAKRGRKDNAVRQGGVKANHQTEAVALVPLRARPRSPCEREVPGKRPSAAGDGLHAWRRVRDRAASFPFATSLQLACSSLRACLRSEPACAMSLPSR